MSPPRASVVGTTVLVTHAQAGVRPPSDPNWGALTCAHRHTRSRRVLHQTPNGHSAIFRGGLKMWFARRSISYRAQNAVLVGRKGFLHGNEGGECPRWIARVQVADRDELRGWCSKCRRDHRLVRLIDRPACRKKVLHIFDVRTDHDGSNGDGIDRKVKCHNLHSDEPGAHAAAEYDFWMESLGARTVGISHPLHAQGRSL